jgi:UDP-GlcNAc:undecaprenyl-phosphate GlcNAc-1-phosphate transferase
VTPYLPVFAVAVVVTFVLTPLARRLAIRAGAVVQPSDRMVHEKPTPTLGGVAIFAGVLAGLGFAVTRPAFKALPHTSSEILAAAVCGGVIMVVGVWDDTRGTSWSGKVAGQILAAGLMVLLGVQLLYFWFPGQGILSLPTELSVPLTIAWILAMVNAVNLIDGLDGLAAGLSAIAAISFFIYIYKAPGLYGATSPSALICAVTAGAAIGFLPWNFHRAKIFMGDAGAMLLGLLIAEATISGVGRNPYPPTGGDLAAFSIPVLIPLVVLAIPFLDVTLAVIRRLRQHRPLTAPDKEHLHHQLLDIGHTHRQAVLLMYLWSALISAGALAVAFLDGRVKLGIILGSIVFVILATALPRWRKARRMRRKGRLKLAA